MTEFAGRNPEPSLRLLVDAIVSESKENVLPPNFDRVAKQAAERMDAGQSNVEEALDEVLQGLSACSPAELGVSALGNMCSAGHANQQFKEALLPHREALVASLKRMLEPLNFRLCGRAAGAVGNLLRLGDAFSIAICEACAEPLVKALRHELSSDRGASLGGLMPGSGSTGRLLGALVNLLVIRPAAAHQVLDFGALALAIQLIGSEDRRREGEEGPDVGEAAELLAARLLSASPTALTTSLEADLVRRLWHVIKRGVGSDAETTEQLERAVRMLTIVMTKTPGGLERLTGWTPRVVELDGSANVAPDDPPVCFESVGAALVKMALALRPKEYVPPDEQSGADSRMRGNLALLLGSLCEAQSRDGAPPALKQLDLSPTVAAWVDTLKKERGAVQHNVGVCVTKLAQSQRYRQQVRDLNGIETLHQVQLPKVEAQKAHAEKQHRLETSSEARKFELHRRQQLRS